MKIDEDCPEQCEVHVDGQSVGTVGALERTVMFDRPDRPHVVRVKCEGEEPVEERYAYIDGMRVPVLSCSS